MAARPLARAALSLGCAALCFMAVPAALAGAEDPDPAVPTSPIVCMPIDAPTVDTTDPAVADVIADWAAKKGTVGVRIMLNRVEATDGADPGIGRVMQAARTHKFPVNMLIWGRIDQARQIAARYPDTQIVIDHLGLQQPFEPPAPPNPWGELPSVLELARYPNVAIKVSGACTLSLEPYPYKDIWDPLARVFDAFTLNRCLWGTDWTRAVHLLNYRQGVDSFRVTDRLSDADRDVLMGGALARIYNWTPSKA